MDALPLPKRPTRDWSELPFDALCSVFANLGVVDLLMGVGLVCHSWLEAAKEPDLWRIVHMQHHEIVGMNTNDLLAMLNVAINRSDGRMEVFVGEYFLTDKLLKYIADRSPNLRHLDLVKCYKITKEGLAEAIPRFPLLEKIVLWGYRRSVTGDLYQVIGKTCNQLECLELCHGSREQTLGIAALQGLRDLALTRCDVNDEELAFIIDSCPLLERLHVRACTEIAGEPGARQDQGNVGSNLCQDQLGTQIFVELSLFILKTAMYILYFRSCHFLFQAVRYQIKMTNLMFIIIQLPTLSFYSRSIRFLYV